MATQTDDTHTETGNARVRNPNALNSSLQVTGSLCSDGGVRCRNEQTQESGEPNTASSSNRNWEVQGARPKTTQTQRTVNPPLWPTLNPNTNPNLTLTPVSDGLSVDFIARHTEDETLRRSVKSDDRDLLSLSHARWLENFSDRNLKHTRPKHTQTQRPVDPPPWPRSSPVSYSLSADFIARHTQDETLLESPERERVRKEKEEKGEAQRWPPQQEGLSTGSLSVCEHYERRCRVKFFCCKEFYLCHHCHNSSSRCQNDGARACDATYVKCSLCQHEQKVDSASDVCSGCGGKLADYFCSTCKHFTSLQNDPFHCDQCGCCRTLKDKSFHCKVCNVCLRKELESNHLCRPNAGNQRCLLCSETVFCSPYMLLCSHALHFACAEDLVKSGFRNCPNCRHPLPWTLFE